MDVRVDRRTLLAGALGLAAQCALGPVAAAATRAGRAQTQELGHDLYVIHGVGANVVALATEQGVLLVDSGDEGSRGELRSQLRRLPGKGRVRTLVNTHWHREQTGGNEVFGKQGATIVAHQKTRQHLATDLWQPASGSYLKALPRTGWPTEAFYTTKTLEQGGRRIDCGYLLEAHTDGDIYVHLADANVLVVGDVVTAADRDPVLDWYGGGWIGGRLDALDALLKIANEQTVIVPAQGPVVGRSELQAERDLFSGLYDKLTVMMRKGFTDQDMLASKVLDTTGRAWHDPAGFLYSAQKGLWAHHNTISHDIV